MYVQRPTKGKNIYSKRISSINHKLHLLKQSFLLHTEGRLLRHNISGITYSQMIIPIYSEIKYEEKDKAKVRLFIKFSGYRRTGNNNKRRQIFIQPLTDLSSCVQIRPRHKSWNDSANTKLFFYFIFFYISIYLYMYTKAFHPTPEII